MTSFKCKMCGGTLEFESGATVGICEYCGSKQTLPKLDDDRRANLYDRANHFRRNNDFDKASGIYEQILNDDSTDAEAYWSLVLCRYGIEYVEDPATHKRIPTVNRAQFTSIFDDDNYKSALQYADLSQRLIYEEEANNINEIQKGILAISQKEDPFDVFICYKETDTNGRRTPDSVLANDLYHQLIQEGFKVFFSRITLEDKLGTAYEPYIFAALNSAKVMVVLGTKPEYFNAVWVKNEWSRYLALVKTSGGKKMLIPAYKDMDPYDLPDEFSHLQAQDMSKLGFMQDLIRGIRKIIGESHFYKQEHRFVEESNAISGGYSTGGANVDSLLKRAEIFLEDGNWSEADNYCEKALDINPENAQAYYRKLMAELMVHNEEELALCAKGFDTSDNYRKIRKYGDQALVSRVDAVLKTINSRNKYKLTICEMNNANSVDDYLKIASAFAELGNFEDSEMQYSKCYEIINQKRKKEIEEKQNRIFVDYTNNRINQRLESRLEEILIYKLTYKDYSRKRAEIEAARKEIIDYEEAIKLLENCQKLYIQKKENESQIKKLNDELKKLGLLNIKLKNQIRESINTLSDDIQEEDRQIGSIISGQLSKYKKFLVPSDLETVDRVEFSIKQIKNRIQSLNTNKIDCLLLDSLHKKYSDKGLCELIDKMINSEVGNIEKYNVADDFYSENDDVAAYILYREAGDYADSKYKAAEMEKVNDKLPNIFELFSVLKKYVNDKKYNKPQYVFGYYHKPIVWDVLESTSDGILLISKNIIEYKEYNNYGESSNWLDSSLRKWLNTEFYDITFSDVEKEYILGDINDRIAILNENKVTQYFTNNTERTCWSTEFCEECGINASQWWLYSLDNYNNCAPYVDGNGGIIMTGMSVNKPLGIRPVIRVKSTLKIMP